MQDFLVSMGLSVIFEVLKNVVKNKDSKEKMRKAMLKLFNAIKTAYPEFDE